MRDPALQGPSERVVAAAFDALSQGVVIADARRHDFPVVYANDAFLRLTGYAPGEVIGRNCRFLQGPGTDGGELERLRTALRTDEPFAGELLNYRRDATPFWNALTVTPLHDEDGITSHWAATQTDVTPLRRRQLLADQGARLALLDSFARGVAHDVNNVLLATSGYAELLTARLAEPEQAQLQGYAQQIVDAAESGRRLTQRLLGLSRGGSGGAADEHLDLVALAAATTALLHGLFPDGIAVRAELPTAQAYVRGDRSQLEQVLLNLLVNARDTLVPPGEVVVRVDAEDDRVRLSVTETGAVRSPEARAQLSDSFFTTTGGRHGLGMLMTLSLVRRLGGTVATTATGAATTVEVSLPRSGAGSALYI